MSNIEPTVTRTMHCTSCNAVGVHTIDASMRNEAVLCPACAESGKRSACVAVEPTEEQKQAARDLYNNLLIDFNMGADIRPPEALARLLAEREAKLREELRGEWARLVEAREVTAMIVEGHQLRARVAELEAKIADAVFSCPGCGRHDFGFFASQIKAACGPCRTRAEAAEARVAELEGQVSESTRLRMTETLHGMGVEAMYQEREAQHLADIKALHQFLGDHEEEEGIWIPRSEFKDVPCRKYLAHYDDAKAAEGGEG